MKPSKEELLESLRIGLSRVPDERAARGIRHRLTDILTVVVLGVMCNCDSVEEIADWADDEDNKAWLLDLMKCPHGLPSEDTILRVLAVIKPKEFDESLKEWLVSFKSALPAGDKQIAVDGKTIRGSANRATGAKGVHVVSAFATATGLSLLQEVVDAKANEIVAIPDLLARLDLRDATVSIDAIGCQREIAAQIVKQQGNYLLAVKDNQPTLHRDLIAYAEWARDPNPLPADPRPEFTTFTQIDGGHGRIEERTAVMLPLSDYISTAKDWKKIAGVGVVESVRTDKLSGLAGAMERRYFIFSDTEMTAEKLLRQAREHWAIENKLHWMLDVAFREDDSRIRAGNAAANLSLVRKLALNLLRGLSLDRKMSLNRKRKACARRPDRVLAAIAAAL